MANRCSSCNKLCALNTMDPEAEFNDVDVGEGGITVSATVRLVRESECCNEEVKETTFDPEESIDWEKLKSVEEHFDTKTGEPLNDDHELLIDEGDIEQTERSEGKGRGLKTFYGFSAGFTVRCACDTSKALYEGSLADDTQASHFDDLG